MYAYDNNIHKAAHIHARYAEHVAVIRIPDGLILSGDLPRSEMKRVLNWIEFHQQELMDAWALSVAGRKPPRIES
ncbi:MAG TPA: DUF4160 domain-containing protein [Rhodothermales bacterium]|nr:DUF4160 domain-containing protein [Rhodothermales bacterium]